MADFTRYARDLGEMLEQPLQAAQQLLAKLYGYADLHELKISLSVAGEAGPYEDKVELEVPDCLKELFYDEFGSAAPRELLAILDEKMMQRAQRTWSLLVEQCGLQRSLPRANPAHALVAAGGFFSSPSAHRAAMSRVRLALAQPSEDDFGIDVTNWPWARLALRTSVAYAISWVGQIDVGKINKEAPDRGPSHEDTPGWAPGADAFVAVAEQAAKLLARYVEDDLDTRDSPIHPWVPILMKRFSSHSFYDGPPTVESLLLGGEEYIAADEIIASLRPGLDAEPDHEVDPVAAERWFEELTVFSASPSEVLAKSHPLLKCIPDAVGFVEDWRWTCFIERMKDAQLSRKEVYIFDVPAHGPGRARRVVVSLIEDGESAGGEFHPLHYYRYGALICERASESKPWMAFGALHGMHIEIAEGDLIGDTDLMWGLDAHSAMLNDVWKVLQFEVALDYGRTSFTELIYEDIEWDKRGVSVVTAHLLKARRGKGELAPMLDSFADAMRNGEMVSELCTPTSGFEIDPFDEPPEDADFYPRRLKAPFLLVCPIEGSRPPPRVLSPAQVMLVSSPRKVNISEADKDAAAEVRREALTVHFGALDLKSVALVVYNPWDYPIT